MSGELQKIKSSVTHIGGDIMSLPSTIHSGITSASNKIGYGLKVAEQDTAHVIEKVPDALSSAGGYIESGALRIGNDVSALESDVVPSFNKVIVETGLVIAGVVALSLVALKL